MTDWFKKHVDTAVVLSGILGAVLWMNGIKMWSALRRQESIKLRKHYKNHGTRKAKRRRDKKSPWRRNPLFFDRK